MLAFAKGTALWTVARYKEALAFYEVAKSHWERCGSQEGWIASTLGTARCMRAVTEDGGRTLAQEAFNAASELGVEALIADALREDSAWALIRGNHSRARESAGVAHRLHKKHGDLYLCAHAQILEARGLNADGERDAALRVVRQVMSEAKVLGSRDLGLTAAIYLGQFLQTGVTSDNPLWREGVELLEDALEVAEDPVSRAEALLPLAQLWTVSGQYSEARTALKEYKSLYALVGGNRIAAANYAKATARLELVAKGNLQYGGFAKIKGKGAALRASREFRRAERLYKRAGLQSAVANIRWHSELLAVLTSNAQGTPSLSYRLRGSSELAQARIDFLTGENAALQGVRDEASRHFRSAEQHAIRAGSTLLALAAAARLGTLAHESRDYTEAAASVKRAIRHADEIRTSAPTGKARAHLTRTMQSHYEQALWLAASIGNTELTLEIFERLRTDRLAGLMNRGTLDELPDPLKRLLKDFDRANERWANERQTRATISDGVQRVLTGKTRGESVRARERERLRRKLRQKTNDVFAEIYDAKSFELEPVLETAPANVLAVIEIRDPDDQRVLVSAWMGNGRDQVTILPPSQSISELRRAALGASWYERASWTCESLAELGPLIPPLLRETLLSSVEPQDLLIIPSGWMWRIPMAAVPLGRDQILVDHANILLCPSLRINQILAGRPRKAVFPTAVSFAVPDLDESELLGLSGFDHVRISDQADAADAVVRGGDRWSFGILIAHGTEDPGLAQAVTDSTGRRIVRSADFLVSGANPPALLSLSVCHGAAPLMPDQHEPLGLTLAALSGGSMAVISSHFEIDEGMGTAGQTLAAIYRSVGEGMPVPRAVAEEQRRPGLRRLPLARWAGICVVGDQSSLSISDGTAPANEGGTAAPIPVPE